MFDVVTIGSATLDILIKSQSFQAQEQNGRKILSLPHGEKIEVEQVFFETGGGATNTATTFKRQGLKTALIAKISKDFAGDKISQALAAEGLDQRFLETQAEATDFSTILWAPDGGQTILVYRGHNRVEMPAKPTDLQSRWFYLTSLEGNLELLEKLTQNYPETKIAFNPGQPELLQKDRLLAILKNITLLILNRTEIGQLLDVPGESLEKVLEKSQTLPVKMLLITSGNQGAFFWDGQNWQEAKPYHVKTVETTGAGDAFGSGFVSGLLKNWPMADCLKLASANAASVVLYPGTKRGILTEAEFKKDWQFRTS